VEAIRAEARAPTTGGSVVVNRLLETLIGDALLGAFDLTSGGAAGGLDPKIASVVAAIMERPEAPWTIDRLARVAAMSRSVFCPRFRSLTGLSPMKYVSEVRLSRAARLLRSTDRTIESIGRSVGYASESAFSRAFKDRLGAPPGEFRREAHSAAGESLTA
jgi:transcriptional regulator GlxA family with amidase domain